MSSDGYCRPFDIAADGYSRSDTIAVAYLQKAKNAKRIYAICPYIKLNSDGYKKEGITYPSSLMQSTLLTEFYNECKIPISCLDYIEAHGTATKVGDLQEVKALHDVFCKNRKTPLMIGSVKSNLGHAEPASGFTQIVKIKQIVLSFLISKCIFILIIHTLYTNVHTNKERRFILYKNYLTCYLNTYPGSEQLLFAIILVKLTTNNNVR